MHNLTMQCPEGLLINCVRGRNNVIDAKGKKKKEGKGLTRPFAISPTPWGLSSAVASPHNEWEEREREKRERGKSGGAEKKSEEENGNGKRKKEKWKCP